jgi:hypothetical protein
MIITNLIDSRSIHPCCFESFFVSVVVVPIHRSQRRRKNDAFDDARVFVDNRSEITETEKFYFDFKTSNICFVLFDNVSKIRTTTKKTF